MCQSFLLGGITDLYKNLVDGRNNLRNTYDDILRAEQKSVEVIAPVLEILNSFVNSDEAVKEEIIASNKVIVNDFEKFFAEEIDTTVPEPYYARIGHNFINTKALFRINTITEATKTALRYWLFFEHPRSILESFNASFFQDWIFELNVAEEDDFNTWLANMLVEVSHEIQDRKFNQLAKYVIDVLHLEAQSESEAAGDGVPLAYFSLVKKPGGTSGSLEFNTRYFELDGQRGKGSEVSEVQFGTESHTTHSGFVSSDQMYTTITLFLQDGQQYTRYQAMGNSEEGINAFRVSNQRAMESIANIYEVTSGGHGFSSSGFRTSYSIGYWF
jgi:hypothetical protein